MTRGDLGFPPQDFEQDEERSANGGSESDGEENIGWSTVNLDEEKQQQDVSMRRDRGLDWGPRFPLSPVPVSMRDLGPHLLTCRMVSQAPGLVGEEVRRPHFHAPPPTMYCTIHSSLPPLPPSWMRSPS